MPGMITIIKAYIRVINHIKNMGTWEREKSFGEKKNIEKKEDKKKKLYENEEKEWKCTWKSETN